LIGEAYQLTTFHPLNGTFDGTLDLGAALRLAQLVVPAVQRVSEHDGNAVNARGVDTGGSTSRRRRDERLKIDELHGARK
jgi:hypothetical protein